MKFGTKSTGLGDTLLLTSVCKYFPNKFTIQLDEKQARFKSLFFGLANVEICQKQDIFELKETGNDHYSTRKLRNFFGEMADGLDNRPLVLYTDMDSERWAYEFLKDKPNPLIFVPTSSKLWSKVRDIPDKFVNELTNSFKKANRTIIACQSSSNYKNVGGTDLIDLDLKKYICLLRRVGFYIGANTGDEHLATAVGCKTVVYQPNDGNGFISGEWNYKHSNSHYFTWE